ncbi:thiamine-phosphate pyrophosphorylase [Salipiger aestuarii]|uniref:Thiamine-phosphate synthase n=1 Tax=Salipiger aestuarii TaxID=568098 RepID=A0A327XZB6_9RHOB|nr:thiamine phosphate synthase [Salipiger aestuarii]EIE51321.1 thiamine-phosphate pyrophosphorylase [Citreicella sp. 357]KAA8607850.1 thiamine-phosphate pyrophosphorylase [Salipiger aestuarii]KAA8610524.1 thiamine-phosphate pyrophosphorylase [Salipiger aestuarii]KAB2536287.1 thiamine-phosphate pyrophosphorylase [Salipiger aestuarii]RAK14073.1 thiamine-phosphate pyrophosphorylase [Salipiger aestuarii]
MRLDPFYLIVSDADALERLVPLGVRLVQLRLKDAGATLPAQIIRARECCAAHGAQLVVNDHWQLALDLGCDAVHLGQEDMDTADVDALRAGGVAFGLSTHDDSELARALALRPAYVALGPVWPTRLKKMKWGPQGLDRVTAWKRASGTVPLVGIGGVTPDRLPALFGAGADCAAVVTDIQTAADPAARCRDWLAATRKWA